MVPAIALVVRERPAERRQMSQHLCAGFSSTSISKFLFLFPVQYKTDHNSWPDSLLKLKSAVTKWISTFNILDKDG